MKPQLYLDLCALYDRHGPREFGKIAQKLLALALREAGCEHVVERGVQGVDVDVAWDLDRYSLEVKTTRFNHIGFGEKDVEGLKTRQRDGYHPLVAALRLGLLAQWYVAEAVSLSRGALAFDTLRPYRRHDLEDRIQPLFEQIVARHFDKALVGAQTYLDEVLRNRGVSTRR